MSNPSKQKGTAAETALLRWLQTNGHPDAVRNPPAGVKDIGDLRCLSPLVLGGGPVTIEVKHYGNVATAINSGLAELDAEMANAGTTHGVLVVRRNGKTDPGEWLAVRKVRNDPEIGAT